MPVPHQSPSGRLPHPRLDALPHEVIPHEVIPHEVIRARFPAGRRRDA